MKTHSATMPGPSHQPSLKEDTLLGARAADGAASTGRVRGSSGGKQVRRRRRRRRNRGHRACGLPLRLTAGRWRRVRVNGYRACSPVLRRRRPVTCTSAMSSTRVYVWGLARALGGRVLLRIEDHDRQRCRPEYEEALLDDLDWLGFEPDIFPPPLFDGGRARAGKAIATRAYRAGAGAARSPRAWSTAATARAGKSTRRSIRDAAAIAGCRWPTVSAGGCVWTTRVETFDDLRLGPQQQTPAEQCGDLLIRDRLGNWTYQWAATTDDLLQGITVVIRGEDLLDSTGRQIAAGAPARPARARRVSPSPAGDEVADAEVQQVGRRHRHPRFAACRVERGSSDRPRRMARRPSARRHAPRMLGSRQAVRPVNERLNGAARVPAAPACARRHAPRRRH